MTTQKLKTEVAALKAEVEQLKNAAAASEQQKDKAVFDSNEAVNEAVSDSVGYMLRAAATVSDLRAEKEEAIASFHRIADHCEALADSNARLSETKNMLQGEVERLCGTIESLRQENAQLRGNLMTFRDGFKAKLSQMAMEARFWNIDIPEQLAS